MSRWLLCVDVWLGNVCERGVWVRLRSWCAATMAGTPLVAVVACFACYRDQGNISWFGWVVVDRWRRLKRLAQVSGGAFLWLESEFGDMAVSPICILWFRWKYLVCVCKESLRWCFEWALMSRCLFCVHVCLKTSVLRRCFDAFRELLKKRS